LSSRGAPLCIDGVIFDLQSQGGISTIFRELLSRLPAEALHLIGYRAAPPVVLPSGTYEVRTRRRLERYRDAAASPGARVFHSSYYRLPSTRGPAVVTSVYDFVYERYVGGIRTSVHSWQKRRAIAHADRVICISESTREDLERFVGARHAARAVVVPCGVGEAFRRVPGIVPVAQVLFVGQRGRYKNFTAVVQAMQAFPELELLCVGGGPFTADESAVIGRNAPARVRWAGFLDDEALNLEYNRSLAFAYPSLYEGFGIPVLEAMRAGCPVIAVRTSSIPEVAGDAAWLMERGDPDELRAAIRALHDPLRRDDLTIRGHARASLFGWQATFRRTLAVYEELLGEPLLPSAGAAEPVVHELSGGNPSPLRHDSAR
jgi:mannosyltransferase